MTLHFDNVVKHYGEGDGDDVVRAVDGVSLEVQPGQMMALSGPSGAGKTTLLLLACGLLTPDAGRITFDGHDISAMSEDQASDFRREEVGILLQSFNLLPGMPADENAGLKLIVDRVPIQDARRQAGRWLKRVGLDSKRDKIPSKLSGGERQRVALVRALLGEPRLIVLDEPTGHLDTARARDILLLLHDFAHERSAALLIVTHDPQALAIADRALTLKDGKLTSYVPGAV